VDDLSRQSALPSASVSLAVKAMAIDVKIDAMAAT
jgi:hypothetical protein